jgi:hypothetical protein
MGRAASTMVAMAVLVALASCGSRSDSTPTMTARRAGTPPSTHRPSPGVGMSAPISKIVIAHRRRPWPGHPDGAETTGSRGCRQEKGRGEINIFTDVPEPSCVRITGRQRVLIVNRTSAFHRREGKPLLLRFGPYSARILPQQGALFGPVGALLRPRAADGDDRPPAAGRRPDPAQRLRAVSPRTGRTALLPERPRRTGAVISLLH